MSDPAPRYRLRTHRGTEVFVDTELGRLRHGAIADHPDVVLATLTGSRLTLYWQRPGCGPEPLCFAADGEAVAPGEPQIFEVEPADGAFGLLSDGKYVCAEPDGRVVHNRDIRGGWECFTLVAVAPAAEPTPDPTLDPPPLHAPIEPPAAEPAAGAPAGHPPTPMSQPLAVAEGGAPPPLPPSPLPHEPRPAPTGWAPAPETFWQRVKRSLFGGG